MASDQQVQGLRATLVFDRDTASRLGITPSTIDQTLYDAYGQREVSTMFTQLNQYHVVLEVKPPFQQNPARPAQSVHPHGQRATGIGAAGWWREDRRSSRAVGRAPPIRAGAATTAASCRHGERAASTAIASSPRAAAPSHPRPYSPPAARCRSAPSPTWRHGRCPSRSTTRGSFRWSRFPSTWRPSASLGDAVDAVNKVKDELGHAGQHSGGVSGHGAGVSGLAGQRVGADSGGAGDRLHRAGRAVRKLHPSRSRFFPRCLRRAWARCWRSSSAAPDFSVIALIGIVLLIGIVKKNAIMMIDFALEAERKEGMPPLDAIYQACLLRFRPIMMTTMAALLGAVPLALGTGTGSELRRPLGITMIGGLIISQMLTLFTTPVIYLFFDRAGAALRSRHRRRASPESGEPGRALAELMRMNISAPFIRRPVATTLLTIAIALAGAVAFRILPVSPLPQVDFPTISVSARLPGASPETMASSVATPLERQFGRIAAVTEMTSSSTLGTSSITLQFDLNRNIDAAARDVQAAIAAARGYLPTNLPEQSHLPQGESGRFAHLHDRAHLQRAEQGRRCTTPRPPSWRRSSRRCRAWARWWWAAARCRACASS